MAKIKVHELAKELDKQSKEIISFLKEKGIEVKVAQSSVEEEAAQMVRKSFPAAGKAAETKPSPKKEAEAKSSSKKDAETKPAPKKEAEVKPAPKKEADPAIKTADNVRSERSGEKQPHKKKKNIIFVSNPQNSKMPGRKPAPGSQSRQGNKLGNVRSGDQRSNQTSQKNQPAAPVRPIKPLTPPSPTPSVQMASPKNQMPGKQPRTEKQVKTEDNQTMQNVQANPAETKSAAENQPQERKNQENQGHTGGQQENKNQNNGTLSQRSQENRVQGHRNQENRAQDNRSQDGRQGNRSQGTRYQGGQANRNDQGGQYQNRGTGSSGQYQNRGTGTGGGQYQNRGTGSGGGQYQNRGTGTGGGQYQNRGTGTGSGGQYQNRGAGGNGGQYQNRGAGGRPPYNNQEGGQGNYRGNGSNQGGNRPYNNNNRDNRSGGQAQDRYRSGQQAKGFTSETAGKDVQKREEEKRRYAQDKDKRTKKDHIYEDESAKNKPGRFIRPEKKKSDLVEETIKVIILPDLITIKDLADKMKIQPSVIVKKLFLSGKIVTVNQEISFEDAESIAMEYDILCEKEVKVDVIEELLKEEEEAEDNLQERPPVICVMGHVDHGKTSLLDAIRKTHVIDKEAGGITQHIGAYTVNLGERKITFLDTPGHEAFTAMRMRGANATDIAILVVAADDGVMPQTIEAINHAKAAGIDIIVAVNKVDKPSANIDRVKQELSEYELIPEDWGGSTVFAPVSAKSGEGIEQLLEMILLTADILELKADPDRRARGLVIEAELDKGRGAVATVLVQKGTLHVGDFISAGSSHGKVRAMIDDKGRRVKEAGPSTPVEILGLSDVPSAGEVFLSHENDKTAKSYAETYLSHNKEKMLEETKSRMSLDDLFTQIKEGNLKELNLIVKADVQGSVEAVKQSLMKLSNDEVIVKCIHGGVGAINESDVMLATASSAIIIGFNVRLDTAAKATVEREGVDVRLYKVIYQAIEDVQAAMKGMLDPVFEEKVIGHAEIRQIFKASAIGNIAGSYVLDGTFQRGGKVRISRDGNQIFEGGLTSLKRFKDDVKEVKAGFECGLVFDGFDQFSELDIVEAYIMVEVPR